MERRGTKEVEEIGRYIGVGRWTKEKKLVPSTN